MDNCIVSSFDVVLQRYLDGIYFGQRIYIYSEVSEVTYGYLTIITQFYSILVFSYLYVALKGFYSKQINNV